MATARQGRERLRPCRKINGIARPTTPARADIMVITRRAFLAVAAVVTAGFSRATPRPDAQATTPTQPVRPGQQKLNLGDARDGLLYVPRSYTPGVATPLVVMLHGAGNTAYSVASMFRLADEFGTLVLAPDSRDERTWDGLLRAWGPDVEFIRDALKDTLNRCSVDQQRITLAGVSDGASYALSLGIGNGDLFSRIVAFSPGVMTPTEVNGKPRIFISHGTRDGVMPIDVTSRRIVARLKALGYDVTYREFDGGHTVPPPIAREAFEWLTQ